MCADNYTEQKECLPPSPNQPKLFVVQSYEFKTMDNVRWTINEAEAAVEAEIGQKVIVCDNTVFFNPDPTNLLRPFAENVRLMGDCDIIYFARGWSESLLPRMLNTLAHKVLVPAGKRIIEETKY